MERSRCMEETTGEGMKGLRAYDVLMAATVSAGGSAWLSKIKSEVQGLPIFLIDDAHLCFYHTIDAKGGGVLHTEQAPATIPFPRFWMEWRQLDQNNNPETYPEYIAFGRYGALCEYSSKASTLLVSLIGCFVATTGEKIAGMISGVILPFDESGICQQHQLVVTEETKKIVESYGQTLSGGMLDGAIGSILFALGLLSAKNVVRREENVPRAMRRHPGPYSSTIGDAHYVLDIPGASDLRRYLEGPGDNKQKRLHIVRGHFADYTEGGGLFGKLHGKYYIAPHVRGSSDRGTITKDYRVIAKV